MMLWPLPSVDDDASVNAISSVVASPVLDVLGATTLGVVAVVSPPLGAVAVVLSTPSGAGCGAAPWGDRGSAAASPDGGACAGGASTGPQIAS
jgi:hypothetical protein